MYLAGVGEDTAAGAVADYYRGQREACGFVPNSALLAFSPRPEVAAAWGALNEAVRGGMDRRRFELATITAARARRSTYCTAAHSRFLRDECGDEESLASIVADPTGAALEPQDRAAEQLAAKVAGDAASVEQDIDHLHEVGLWDADIADIVSAAGRSTLLHRCARRSRCPPRRADGTYVLA